MWLVAGSSASLLVAGVAGGPIFASQHDDKHERQEVVPVSGTTTSTTTTADAASPVMEGRGEFPPQLNVERVSMNARDYEIMRVAANARLRDVSRQTRETRLSAAVSSGRIAQAAVGEWRARYNREPRETTQALEALPAGAHRAEASPRPSAPGPARPEVESGASLARALRTVGGVPENVGATTLGERIEKRR